ncbi:hypothetical protein [Nocardia sp. NPDC050412]
MAVKVLTVDLDALAEATVQLRGWQHGAALVDQVPSLTSKP